MSDAYVIIEQSVSRVFCSNQFNGKIKIFTSCYLVMSLSWIVKLNRLFCKGRSMVQKRPTSLNITFVSALLTSFAFTHYTLFFSIILRYSFWAINGIDERNLQSQSDMSSDLVNSIFCVEQIFKCLPNSSVFQSEILFSLIFMYYSLRLNKIIVSLLQLSEFLLSIWVSRDIWVTSLG